MLNTNLDLGAKYMQNISTLETPNLPATLDTSIRFIQPTLPNLGDVFALYQDVYSSGLVTNGALVERFEDAVREFTRAKHCVAVSSCTSGLMLTMKALDLYGDVVLPSFTFFASGEAVLWNDLRPVFADCDLETWNVSVPDVERRLNSRTAAILGVHMYGNPCAVDELTSLAAKSGCKLIFDAAHAFGSLRQGKPLGGNGDAEVFSLSPTKLLVAGEGGLVTTNDSTLARRLRLARNYGDGGAYDPELLGLNARMSEFNAALGLEGLKILQHKVRRHLHIAALYTELLKDVPGVRLQTVATGDQSTYKDFSIHVSDPGSQPLGAALCNALAARRIPTKRYFYPPLHRQKVFAGLHTPAHAPLQVTDFISSGIVSLPIYASLADKTIEMIASTVRETLASWSVKEVWQ
jgi:dTDP-4-amino-4,6-dideoxygalactose transaminase